MRETSFGFFLAVGFDCALGQGEIARDIDDVERDRAAWQRRNLSAGTRDADARSARHTGKYSAPIQIVDCHVRFLSSYDGMIRLLPKRTGHQSRFPPLVVNRASIDRCVNLLAVPTSRGNSHRRDRGQHIHVNSMMSVLDGTPIGRGELHRYPWGKPSAISDAMLVEPHRANPEHTRAGYLALQRPLYRLSYPAKICKFVGQLHNFFLDLSSLYFSSRTLANCCRPTK